MRPVHPVHRTRSQHPPTTHGQASTLPQFHHPHLQRQWHLSLPLRRRSHLTNRWVTSTHEFLDFYSWSGNIYNEDTNRQRTGTHEDSDNALAGANRRATGRQTSSFHSTGVFSLSLSPYVQFVTCRRRGGSYSLLGIRVDQKYIVDSTRTRSPARRGPLWPLLFPIPYISMEDSGE